MAVIIEGLSVLLRCRSISQQYKGGFQAFISSLHAGRLCADGELVAISLDHSEQVDSCLMQLRRKGLHEGADIVVADQIYGLNFPCNWLSIQRIYWNQLPSQPILIASASNSQLEGVATPTDWEYAESLSKKVRYLDGTALPAQVTYIRTENDMDVLKEDATGDLLYVPLRMRV